ncbi:GRAM domain-containing protein 2B GRAM domain-containing protein 3 [Larimichthys crocea]|uniref:GRAM domain-containing protein 2B GRAM domain-containing protein 3 n=1 Tax=Larimichthys crocea TaxID=215358 RepID=A0A6G0IR95_LARCR|nr:GRAM domain-containing protein 2B GRAM domain-containing protein 3 [Larimichthys crocea]
MLENKRERLKTFLRKIDEKAIVKIKHFMKESSYPVESSGGGLPAKVKKSRSSLSNGSIKKVETRKALSLEAAQLEIQQQHKTLTRQVAISSETFDVDSRSFERTEGTGTQSSFMKHNKTFHKLFPDIPKSEDLIHAYICALQKEVPYHGRLYITDTNACFYSSVLLKDTKVVIPVSCIHIVKKQNTALLVPNALSLRTSDGDKYLFVSLRNRESCYQLLRSVCPQIEDGSTNSSPIFSSAENSFDKSKLVNTSQSSLDDSFDQFDGSESQSLQEQPLHRPHRAMHRWTKNSVCFGAMTLCPSLMTNGVLTLIVFLLQRQVPNANVSAFRSLHLQQSDSSSSEELSASGGSWVWNVTEKAKSLLVQREASTLNTLLFIYLILVVLLLLSSGYIGLRIVALEEQLTSLGALPEFTLQSGYRRGT